MSGSSGVIAGPGDYNGVSVSPSKSLFNTGSVPFGNGAQRFNSDYDMKFYALPGPGHYSNEKKRRAAT